MLHHLGVRLDQCFNYRALAFNFFLEAVPVQLLCCHKAFNHPLKRHKTSLLLFGQYEWLDQLHALKQESFHQSFRSFNTLVDEEMGIHAHNWLNVPVESPFISRSMLTKAILNAFIELTSNSASHEYLVVPFDLAIS